jgi:hypothetical protein
VSRRRPCGLHDAQSRVSIARAYLRTALDHPNEDAADRNVVGGNAVLAAIAAADAICCLRLGMRNSSDRHADAIALLETVVPDGKSLARDLQTVLAEKDAVQYGVTLVSESRTKRILRAAEKLVTRADDLVRTA